MEFLKSKELHITRRYVPGIDIVDTTFLDETLKGCEVIRFGVCCKGKVGQVS